MRVKIESCARELRKTTDGRDYTGIKVNGTWLNCTGDVRNLYNKEVDLDIKGKWARVIESQDKPAASNGKAASNDHLNQHLNQHVMAEAVDFWWEKVKAMELVDEAKASVLCTLLIATADGRVKFEEPELPPDDDPDSTIPF